MPAISTLTDDFSTSPITTKWPDTYGTAGLDSGRAYIDATPNVDVTNAWAGIRSDNIYSLDSMAVEVIPATVGTAPNDLLGTTLSFNRSTEDGTRVIMIYNQTDGQLDCVEEVAYGGDANVVSVPWDGTAMRWWRITVTGGNILYQTSPDGLTWTTRRTRAVSGTAAWVGTETLGFVMLEAYYYGTGSTYRAYFDNFNVAPSGGGTPTRESIEVDLVNTSAWVNGTTTLAFTYPAGAVVDSDMLVLVIHNKASTTTPPTPTNWTSVGSFTGGGGTNGSGAGPTRMTVFVRPVVGTPPPAGGALNVSTGANVSMGQLRLYRIVDMTRANKWSWASNITDIFGLQSWSDATANTTLSGTTAAMALRTNDHVTHIIGTTDDAASNIAITSVAATGLTFSALEGTPNSTAVNASGNQLSSRAYDHDVTAGDASAAVAVTGTSNASETGMGIVLRIRIEADVIVSGPEPGRMLLAC